MHLIKSLLLSLFLLSLASVTVSPDHNRLFWTDWKIGSIHMHDLVTNETRELIDSSAAPIVVHVWDERLQPPGDNPCKHKNANCSHLCLLSNSTSGFTCKLLITSCIVMHCHS